MSTAPLQQALPAIGRWIMDTLERHSSAARPVSSLGFERLRQYYLDTLLENAKFVAINRVPAIPLTALGLPGFEDFENMEVAGITYLDTYFICADQLRDEALHFHELVHVVQWQHLGQQNFMLGYALGHKLSGGYYTNPYEKIAYALQADFENETAVPDLVSKVQTTAARDFTALRQQAGLA